MVDFVLYKLNEAYLRVEADRGLLQELSEYFTFYVPGYKFMPAFKNRIWDGKIRLLDLKQNIIYSGLLNYIIKFCDERGYTLKVDPQLTKKNNISKEEVDSFISSLDLPFEVRDYQKQAFIEAINNKKLLLLSPTGSGKSLIIYLIIRYLQKTKQKGLLIVPTISLVSQMFKDFESYGYDSETYCHMVYGGQDKHNEKYLTISTWQSIYKLDKKYFEEFDFVIGDEAHQFKAKSLTSILDNCTNTEYRIGTTGTLDGTMTHRLVLEGIFGSVYKATSTSDLIKNKQLSEFNIKCLILKYPDEICKSLKKKEYQEEIDYIVTNTSRNNYIKNLVLSLKGNTLLLFQFVEKHGEVLYNMISENNKGRKIFFIHGKIDIEERELVRQITEKENDAIIIASYGTFSTGVNIRNLHNIIFGSPSKSKIRNLQSIGRVLRLGDNKEKATLFDITDDLRIGKHTNHTLKHFIERVKIYDEEKFKYKFYNIDLKL